jgi:hypothetical protein
MLAPTEVGFFAVSQKKHETNPCLVVLLSRAKAGGGQHRISCRKEVRRPDRQPNRPGDDPTCAATRGEFASFFVTVREVFSSGIQTVK